jgi:hypothetical protein
MSQDGQRSRSTKKKGEGGTVGDQPKVGARLHSATCSTEVVVVKAPTAPVDIRCGGEPLADSPVDDKLPLPDSEGEPTVLGKRYVDEDSGVELLAVKPGDGSLTVDGRALVLKGAKPLPSSD